MIETVEFKGKKYPKFQTNGNSLRFIKGFIDEVCKADYENDEFGYNIGCGKLEWNYPERAIPIDLEFENGLYHAFNLPKIGASYVVAGHLLEHLDNYVGALQYWKQVLKDGGVIVLYLPHPDQEYWLPQNNRKHIHIFYPKDIEKCLIDLGFKNVFVSERDLYHAFVAIAQK